MTSLAAPRAESPATPAGTLPARSGTALAWSIAALFCAVYSALSIRDQQQLLTTGYDLGIFDEAVRAYAHGRLPIVPLKGAHFDLLGDHFSPAWALLAPFYRVFPTVYTLLIAQAALIAAGAVPLVRWATDELGLAPAAAVGAGYGASWGIASAIGFDVHEVAFAVPLLAFSATALGRRRWRAAVLWALPLLLVKEDLGATLAAIGVYVACHGPRRLGLATAAAGLFGSWLEIDVLIPAANPRGVYPYGGTLRDALRAGPDAIAVLVTPEIKTITVLMMLAPTAFLALRSPLTLLTVPTLAWRFLSGDPGYWGTASQYSAVLMPIVFAGFIDALTRMRAVRHTETRTLARVALAAGLLVTATLLHDFPLARLGTAAAWRTDPRVYAARHVLGLIPAGTTVAAGNHLVPQLTDRDTVTLLDPGTPQTRPAWVVVDTQSPGSFPITAPQQAELLAVLRAHGYRTAADDDGYLLLKRTWV